MPPRAIIFDFDGLLADTENVHVAAWERTFDLMGWEVPPETCLRGAEQDDHEFLFEVFIMQSILDGDLDGWVRRKQALTRQLLADVPRLYPGVPDLIRQLHGRARLAVVSTTWRENVEVTLNAAGLLDLFDVIIPKELIRRPKPDKTCYRQAVRHLTIPARETVVVLASFLSFSTANRAELPSLAVGHRLPKSEWPARTPFVPDLTDTPAVLRALGFAPDPR